MKSRISSFGSDPVQVHPVYVNLHDVTNLGLYNKLILVTQKQILEFYVIAIECKTLNGLMVPHTAFPKCITTTTKATMNTTTRVHVTKAVIGTQHQEKTSDFQVTFDDNVYLSLRLEVK